LTRPTSLQNSEAEGSYPLIYSYSIIFLGGFLALAPIMLKALFLDADTRRDKAINKKFDHFERK